MAILQTREADCRDCYACVRSCPVKAIKITTGHAQVVADMCILDGTCIAACPQGAKQVADNTDLVRTMLATERVAFSLAPSIAAFYTPAVVAAALRQLGAVAVTETAETAGWVSLATYEAKRNGQGSPVISSSCPAVVNLVEKYYPGCLTYLAPVVSPMIAHGRVIKSALGNVKVVFVGPCIAKKEERINDVTTAVDVVLTFTELDKMLSSDLPNWQLLPAEGLDHFVGDVTRSTVRQFPLPGGMKPLLPTSADDVLVITGVKRCAEFLADFVRTRQVPAAVVELMACEGGCVGGPTLTTHQPLFRNEMAVRMFAAPKNDELPGNQRANYKYGQVPLARTFTDRRPRLPQPSEEEIKAILASIGKHNRADELNCGACGYDSCRDKAIAVFRGLAEREMCIPYMRSKAESLAEVTIAATPTAVLVVNRSLHLLALNPAAELLFNCHTDEWVGRPLPQLIPANRVEQVFSSGENSTGITRFPKYDIVVREMVAYDAHNDLAIILLTDITAEMAQQKELTQLKDLTLSKAQEVIDRQMRVAQEIAGLLGETTAETKFILTELMRILAQKEDEAV